MKQLIEDLINAMEYHVEQTRPIHMTTVAIQAAKDALKAMPAQEPESLRDAVFTVLEGFTLPHDVRKILEAAYYATPSKRPWVGREWNFCERCGKRTKDLTTIHTCTPPQEGE